MANLRGFDAIVLSDIFDQEILAHLAPNELESVELFAGSIRRT